MSEIRPDVPPPHGTPDFDRDIQVRKVVLVGVGLAAVTLLVFLLMGLLVKMFHRLEVAQDPPPPPLPEAAVRRLPPEPRLQIAPEQELQEMREEEEEILTSYGWVDREVGIARIPIHRALEILAERGLPAREGAEPGEVGIRGTAPTEPSTASAEGSSDEESP